MSDLDEVLAHYGVKGMKWGVRKNRTGGSRPPMSDDAANAKAARSKVRKGGTKALTNKELQNLVDRMNLEQRYEDLSVKRSTVSRGQRFVRTGLELGATAALVAKSPAGAAVKKYVFKR